MKKLIAILFTSSPKTQENRFIFEKNQKNYLRSLFLSKFMIVIALLMLLISVFENDLQTIINFNIAFVVSIITLFILFLFSKRIKNTVVVFHNSLVIIMIITVLLWGSSLIAFAPDRYEMFGTYSLIIISIGSIVYLKWTTQLLLQMTSLIYIFTVYAFTGDFFLSTPVIPKITVIIFLNIFAWGISRLLYYNNLENYQLDNELNNQNELIKLEVDKKTNELTENLKTIKLAQEELRNSEKKIRLFLDSTMEGIYGVDVDGVCTFINKSALEILGYQMDEVIGKHMHDIVHHSYSNGSLHPIEDCRMKKFILAEKAYSGEDILWCKNGSFIYVERSFKPQIIDKKIQGGIMMFRDVTESKRIQENLKASESNLRQAQEIGKIGSWELTLKDNKIWASEEAFKIYGIPGKNEYIDFSKVHNMTTTEDQNRLAAELEGLILNNKTYEITFKLNTDDGKEKFIYSRASLFKDVHGKPEKVIGVIRDITDTKQKELELEYAANNDFLTGIYNRRYYEENLATLDVKENYPLTIIMSDINGLKLINDAFGHKSGDDLLVSAVSIMRDSCSEKDLLARIGGDEFVMILPNTNEIEAEEIIKSINRKTKKIIIESIPLSMSFGYKTKRNKTEDIQEVFRSAEDSMYRQKLIEIPSMRSGAIETILTTLYEKDKNSELHSRTVSVISEKLAKAYGLDRQEVSEVKTAGLLHDIGKIIISEIILKKEGKLTDKEYESIKTHPEIGFRILNSTSDMRGISNIVLNHHERWDGKGYPRGIKSDEIPLKSRIISIADSFDAMTSERTYRDVISNEEALQEIIDNAGTQFDPELAKVFKEHFSEIIVE